MTGSSAGPPRRSAGEPLGLGLVGAGAFAEMVAEALEGLADLRLVAVTDLEPRRAEAFATAHGGRAVADVRTLLSDAEVDVVAVTTPPGTHRDLALAALAAGRHVFCEKPLATTTSDARDVVAAAAGSGLVVVVDHVLRHNPLLAAVVRLQETVLGPPQRFLFENDASDERLLGDHWFWDPEVSGGILLEHGVHAFDVATWLMGSMPTHVQTMTARRDGPDGHSDGVVDLVSTTALHPGGRIATHTHSFTHADRCERQLLRLDHGAAETVIHGWIPVEARIELWTDDDGVERVLDVVRAFGAPEGSGIDARAHCDVERDAGPATARGRGTDLHIPHRVVVELSLGGAPAKQTVYAASVRAGLADLAACVRSGAEPRSGVVAAAAAVTVAAAATRAAHTGSIVSLVVPPPPVLAPAPEPRRASSEPADETPADGIRPTMNVFSSQCNSPLDVNDLTAKERS